MIIHILTMTNNLFCLPFVAGVQLEFPYMNEETIEISENNYTNLTFWFNTSSCEPFNKLYKVTLKIKTDTGFVEYDERFAVVNNTCNTTARNSLRCVSPAGPVELNRKVNRSHAQIEWRWRWMENDSFMERQHILKLNISCKYSIKYLTLLLTFSNSSDSSFFFPSPILRPVIADVLLNKE